MAADRLDEVLDAAYECLARYGARRTTVDDIASVMGVSRSAVYQYVRSKDDAVRQLAGRLHDQAFARAADAATADGTAAERIRGVLAAKFDLVLDLRAGSPHGAELLDQRARLFGDICTAFTDNLRNLLIELFTAADTAAPHSPDLLADACIALVAGLESSTEPRRLFDPAVTALLTGLLQTHNSQ
ncbi:TetR/AcrR family transcriptional regulator [Nocardia sp. NPDC055049]